MTYKQPNISAKVTTLMGYEATFADGKDAYEAFANKKTITGKADGSEIIIPFHAVKIFEKTVSAAEKEKADAYC